MPVVVCVCSRWALYYIGLHSAREVSCVALCAKFLPCQFVLNNFFVITEGSYEASFIYLLVVTAVVFSRLI